jgi:uncharacterized membrane protein YedE/YeeE
MNVLKKPRWSPYVIGAGIGVLSWITFGAMHKALGVSTTFVRVAGLIESIFSTAHVKANAYYEKYLIASPAVDWQMLLVIGLFIGAMIASLLGKSRIKETVPELWASKFGRSKGVRYLGAFIGGILVLIGARLAGGCTSGHGISGGMQYAIGSWVFFVTFFGAGLATAFALYGKEGRSHV